MLLPAARGSLAVLSHSICVKGNRGFAIIVSILTLAQERSIAQLFFEKGHGKFQHRWDWKTGSFGTELIQA
eukprot:9180467-Karenia_brevis.AAC.1